ncbi:CDP-diacylglycerol---serine O-phosphatidyltransferase [Mariprofundus micogutta]|uniref:CDP-diacylglycerol--serine O-phosphatidyltransferase n=1 Tax=Mariprofundus micogutta TaxID=1921010 RepID=A0A1L8CQG0_9PROT|nr:CDP-diacylglycerol--serine O-phosphatidyltransferase [Mariprofundus micogutta]GAV21166.1 CDP-diacylglycerol---serine O-phosphatidyltransferase [Mariprofundus micogutta]
MPRFKEKMGKRGVYLLPSLFTTMGLFAGFYSLVASIQGNFELAAWSILAAAVFDMLDGRVARMLHAETEFGAEYDSLCDMLSFGVAPGVLVYMWALINLGPDLHKLAWLGGFFVVACAAIRLARFNVHHEQEDKRYFQGLPTPGAALFIATAVLYHVKAHAEPWPWLWLALALILSWLMVSNVRFFAGKDVDLKQRHSTSMLVIMIAVMGLMALDPYRVPFGVMFLYIASGPALSLWQGRRLAELRMKRKLRKKKASSVSGSDSSES